jgi:hypothetical protein
VGSKTARRLAIDGNHICWRSGSLILHFAARLTMEIMRSGTAKNQEHPCEMATDPVATLGTKFDFILSERFHHQG